jgi:hypothetical protein
MAAPLSDQWQYDQQAAYLHYQDLSSLHQIAAVPQQSTRLPTSTYIGTHAIYSSTSEECNCIIQLAPVYQENTSHMYSTHCISFRQFVFCPIVKELKSSHENKFLYLIGQEKNLC